MFFTFCIKASKCSGSCNNINNPCAQLCIPDVAKNLNVKVLNLVPGINETRRMEWHETCKCKCRFNNNVCNNVVFVIINNVGMMINPGVNAKN